MVEMGGGLSGLGVMRSLFAGQIPPVREFQNPDRYKTDLSAWSRRTYLRASGLTLSRLRAERPMDPSPSPLLAATLSLASS